MDTDISLLAAKASIAEQIRKRLKEKNVTTYELAKLMKTSQPSVVRLINPNVSGLTLDSLVKAAVALDLKLEVTLRAN